MTQLFSAVLSLSAGMKPKIHLRERVPFEVPVWRVFNTPGWKVGGTVFLPLIGPAEVSLVKWDWCESSQERL